MSTQLTIIDPKEFGLEESKAVELTSGLKNILDERNVLIDAYNGVIELEITTENLKTFKELRLQIRDNRTKGIEKWHKVNKEFFLTGGRFVDAIKNKEVAENERMEEKLLAAEKHFENLEIERLNKVRIEREQTIAPFGYDFSKVDLSGMDEKMFEMILTGAKKTHEDKLAAEKLAEEQRLEKEKRDKLTFERDRELRPYEQYSTNIIDLNEFNLADLSEESFIDIKNKLQRAKLEKDAEFERLKRENELKEKQLKEAQAKADAEIAEQKRLADIEAKKQAEILAKQKAESEAILKKEQEAKAKLEAELKAKADAELKEKQRVEAEQKAKLESEKKAAKAPDKDKMKIWINELELLPIDLKTKESNAIATDILTRFAGFKKWANEQIESI